MFKGVSRYQAKAGENPGPSYSAGTSAFPPARRGGAQRPTDTQISHVLWKGDGARKELKKAR